MKGLQPVLVVAFNRPVETARLISRLREVRPAKVYFAVDGARDNLPDEISLVSQTQKLADQFDWGCELITCFQSRNLGCGLGVSTAISWVFSKEESVIVLEDDVLPDTSFFPFCEELLERFREDERVFAISGSNFVPPQFLSATESYRFSPITHVWGWAIWKSSWDRYVYDISDWKSEITFSQLRHQLGGSWLAAILWSKIFNMVAQGKIDTWDYQLVFASLKSNSLIATSNVNLTENIGFSNTATHTKNAPKYILPTHKITFPLEHPRVNLDSVANDWTQRYVHGASLIIGIRLFSQYVRLLVNPRRK